MGTRETLVRIVLHRKCRFQLLPSTSCCSLFPISKNALTKHVKEHTKHIALSCIYVNLHLGVRGATKISTLQNTLIGYECWSRLKQSAVKHKGVSSISKPTICGFISIIIAHNLATSFWLKSFSKPQPNFRLHMAVFLIPRISCSLSCHLLLMVMYRPCWSFSA